MSNGVNATEILRGIIKPQHNEDVIQTAIKMASLPSNLSAGTTAEAKISNSSKSKNGSSNNNNDKCPLLMELLYKSFQARLAKEHRLKALQIEHQNQEKSSSLKPNHSSAISALVAAAHNTVPTSVAAAAHVGHTGPPLHAINANHTLAATTAPATNPMEAAVNPFPAMSNPELMAAAAAAALNQQHQQQQAAAAVAAAPPPPPAPQPPLASYPLFSYYMNPMWASAAQYFQQPQSLMIQPNQLMQLGPSFTSQVAAAAGIKRAAAPVIYPNSGTIEKRMKLA